MFCIPLILFQIINTGHFFFFILYLFWLEIYTAIHCVCACTHARDHVFELIFVTICDPLLPPAGLKMWRAWPRYAFLYMKSISASLLFLLFSYTDCFLIIINKWLEWFISCFRSRSCFIKIATLVRLTQTEQVYYRYVSNGHTHKTCIEMSGFWTLNSNQAKPTFPKCFFRSTCSSTDYLKKAFFFKSPLLNGCDLQGIKYKFMTKFEQSKVVSNQVTGKHVNDKKYRFCW